MQTRLLAWLCRLCPFCNAARLWPRSGFARKLAEVEKDCPACRAYRQVYGVKNRETGAE